MELPEEKVHADLDIFGELPPDKQEVMADGRCFTCEQEIDDHGAIVVLSPAGVMGSFCSGQCYLDSHIMGWLREVMDETQAKIDFRKEGAQ